MSPARMSKIESAIRVALAFHKAYNQHDVAAMMALVAPACVFESPHPAPSGTTYTGKEAISQYWQDFFQSAPHAQLEIEEAFSMGHRCILRWRFTNGDGDGGVRGVDVFKEEDNLLVELLSYVKN